MFILLSLSFLCLENATAQGCPPISTMACNQIQVNLPYSLSFESAVTGTIADKNGAGTGFTMVDTYSGTRLSEDGAASNTSVPGYEPTKLTLSDGRLQIVSNKGIASLTANNQLNSLGVKINSQDKRQIETTIINPFNGTSFQQGGLFFGLNDKTYLKLVIFNNKVQLYKEVNDISGTSDNRLTASITGLDTKTVKLRLIFDPATNTAEGFYSTDGTTFLNVGAGYSTPSLSVSDMGLSTSTANTGIFATYRNGTTPITYTFEEFSVISPTPTTVPTCTASGSIARELWTGISGNNVSAIPLSTTPSATSQLSSFETPSNAGDSYGQRLRGYICAPATGTYTFYIASDDNSELWLSTSDDPSRKVLIASVTGWAGSREWTKFASQKSVSITLQQGQRYYIEALHKEGSGGDNLAVGWQTPGTTSVIVIPGSVLSPFSTTTVPVCSAMGSLTRELWSNVSGTAVSAIPVSTAPSSTTQLTSMETPANAGDNYGQRLRGYICAPATGIYTFYVASDDNSELWLSTSDNPSAKRLMASVVGWTNPREWTKFASQKSVTVSLQQGAQYYIEVLHKEGSGGDHLAVGWQTPGATSVVVIPGSALTAFTATSIITVSPVKLYDNDVAGGAEGINRVVTIKNTSTTNSLQITGINLSGANGAEFLTGNMPALPASIAPQATLSFTVAFNPSSVGLKTALLNIASNDASRPTVQVPLRGLGTAGLGGANEPSLQALLNLWEIPVLVGDDDANTNVIHSNTTQQKAALLGEEISLQKFIKAGTGPVTLEPLAVFGPTTSNPVLGAGWYKSGDSTSKLELFTVSNTPASNGQTVNVNFSGALSFDPGAASFGFYSRWPFFANRHLYSEDALNTFSGSIPHHVRVYPFKDASGQVVPSTYVVAFEEHTSGFDYQDLVFVVRNVKSAPVNNGGNPPVFSSSSYWFGIGDDVAVQSVAGSVSAKDPEGHSISYSLTAGNTNGAFSIDAASGEIRVAKVLNHHTQSQYTLTVRATDAGGISSQATVSIVVNPAAGPAPFSTLGWGTGANQPYNVSEAQGKAVAGKLFSFGGFDALKMPNYTPTDRAYMYNPGANTWTPIASMPPQNGTGRGGVTHAGMTTDGTDIYFAGGYTANAAGTGQIFGTPEVWKYIVAENRYVRLPDLPVAISAGQLEYLNGRLHHIAGTNSARTQDLDLHYVLDLGNLGGGWKILAPLPNPRHHAGSTVYKGRIYFIGGQKGHDGSLITQKDVHVYDPLSNTWTKVADLPVPVGATGRGHISSAVAVIGEQIVVIGGETKHGTSVNLVSSYNQATDTWSNLSPLPANRSSGVAATLGHQLYYTGGSNTATTYRGIPAATPRSNAQLFVENMHSFPNNEDFIASRIQNPWSRDKVVYNTNHDTVKVRLHNKGMNSLVISSLYLSSKINWQIVTLGGAAYDAATALPLTIAPGTFTDLQVKFTSPDTTLRVKIILDELSIASNDDKSPTKTVYLRGIWQRFGEGGNEPTAQEMISAFGFKTRTGFVATDPDRGANNRPKGDEVLTSYFVRADASRPVTVRQMGAYHGCCNQSESISWYQKGNSGTLNFAAYHVPQDAQRLLPRSNPSVTNYHATQGSFSPTTPFGFKIGARDWTDTLLNPNRLIGIRIWKAVDKRGQVIPNAYILANDYLGTEFTNYDYNDNMYYVTNVRPELGPAAVSTLVAAPQAVEFGEQLLNSTISVEITLKNLGVIHSGGAQDPSINITAIALATENKEEFAMQWPKKTTLSAQETTTMVVQFKPLSEGLKTTDLLIYYNNALSPLRVPLHGLAKAQETMVSVPYRIKSGSSVNVVVNGKTYVSDTAYARDNLEPYRNGQLSQIGATEEDMLYLSEQSSNADKRPFRYEMAIANGTYWVRLHFAEIYWGLPGGNLNGGAGSRVMSVQLENQLRLINLDVVAEVGTASAFVRNFPVSVTDGKLDINFSATTNRPMIAAIEVYRFTSGTITNNIITTSENDLIVKEQPRVYPNPVQGQFTIEFPTTSSGAVNLQLVDMAGRTYELGKAHLQKGGTTLSIDVSKLRLTPGVYYLRIHSEDGKSDHIKLLIQ